MAGEGAGGQRRAAGQLHTRTGRKRTLTAKDEAAIVEIVKKWCGKRFSACKYIAQAFKPKAGMNTISSRALNQRGYFWRPVPKIRGLTAQRS